MRLRELRLERNMSQQRLAMELSMTQNTISRYENGEREPGIKELIRIADYSVFDPVFVLAAVLEWAGIVINGRGELILTEAYREAK